MGSMMILFQSQFLLALVMKLPEIFTPKEKGQQPYYLVLMS